MLQSQASFVMLAAKLLPTTGSLRMNMVIGGYFIKSAKGARLVILLLKADI